MNAAIPNMYAYVQNLTILALYVDFYYENGFIFNFFFAFTFSFNKLYWIICPTIIYNTAHIGVNTK